MATVPEDSGGAPAFEKTNPPRQTLDASGWSAAERLSGGIGGSVIRDGVTEALGSEAGCRGRSLQGTVLHPRAKWSNFVAALRGPEQLVGIQRGRAWEESW